MLDEQTYRYSDAKKIALVKILKNLPMIEILAIFISLDQDFVVNIPPTVKKLYLCSDSWTIYNIQKVKVPFDCVVSYKHVCCIENIINQ